MQYLVSNGAGAVGWFMYLLTAATFSGVIASASDNQMIYACWVVYEMNKGQLHGDEFR